MGEWRNTGLGVAYLSTDGSLLEALSSAAAARVG